MVFCLHHHKWNYPNGQTNQVLLPFSFYNLLASQFSLVIIGFSVIWFFKWFSSPSSIFLSSSNFFLNEVELDTWNLRTSASLKLFPPFFQTKTTSINGLNMSLSLNLLHTPKISFDCFFFQTKSSSFNFHTFFFIFVYESTETIFSTGSILDSIFFCNLPVPRSLILC